jgi:hypothetical protein
MSSLTTINSPFSKLQSKTFVFFLITFFYCRFNSAGVALMSLVLQQPSFQIVTERSITGRACWWGPNFVLFPILSKHPFEQPLQIEAWSTIHGVYGRLLDNQQRSWLPTLVQTTTINRCTRCTVVWYGNKDKNPRGKQRSIRMKCLKSEVDGVVFTGKIVH